MQIGRYLASAPYHSIFPCVIMQRIEPLESIQVLSYESTKLAMTMNVCNIDLDHVCKGGCNGDRRDSVEVFIHQ